MPARMRDRGGASRALFRRPSRRLATELLLLALAPAAIYFVYGVVAWDLGNGSDPFFYAGLQHDFHDWIARNGYDYHSVRFSLILPGVVLDHFLSPVAAHLVLRYGLALLAIVPLYLAVRLRCGARVAWIVVPAVLLNPVVLKAVMTTYSDTIGVPVSLGAVGLLASPRRPGGRAERVIIPLLLGVCAGLAFHANPFAVGPFGAAVLGWWLVERPGWRAGAARAGYVLAGFAACTAVGVAVYWAAFGDADLLTPIRDALGRLGGAEADLYRLHGHRWVDELVFLWSTPLLLATLGGLLLSPLGRQSPHRRLALGALAVHAAVALVYLVDDVLLGGNTLPIYYYSSYLAVPVSFSAMAIVAVCQGERGSGRRVPVTAGVGLLLVGLLHRLGVDGPHAWAHVAVPVAAVLLLLALRAAVRWRAAGPAVLAALACVTAVGLPLVRPSYTPKPGLETVYFIDYGDEYGKPRDDSLDLLRLLADVHDQLPKMADGGGTLQLWIGPVYYTPIAIGGSYGWPLFGSFSGDQISYPALDNRQVRQLNRRTPRYVAVVNGLAQDNATGEAALRANGPAPVGRREIAVAHGSWQVHITVLEYRPSPCDEDRRSNVKWVDLPPCGSAG